ncbi:hypothetical protein AB833_06345 [Chromatiales bacterium (ex Bugula neritina AB1)]|nr:hypothetical protein AB833_06345 [Chromatiales bacterium (ex Bugula neritina AB1)]
MIDDQLNPTTDSYCWYESPVGKLLCAGNDEAITHIAFPAGQGTKVSVNEKWRESTKPFRALAAQLDQYFDRELTTFDLPLAPVGTAFQQQVWQALIDIPYGRTVSYGSIANAIDNPKAVRAVGNANGRNPIPIIIPCHRVIGRDGTLTGFGGGLPTKNFLLELENRQQLCLPF